MQSIERYGVVALVFLVVTVGAVLIWNRRDQVDSPKEAEPTSASDARGASPARGVPPIESNRVTLRAEPSGRPLWRDRSTAPSPSESAVTSGPPLAADPAAGGSSAAQDAGAAAPEELAPVADEVAQSPTRAYVVRASDTLSEIAERELGTQRRWTEILALNPGISPTQLRAGQKIALPAKANAAKAGAAPAASGPPKEALATPVVAKSAPKPASSEKRPPPAGKPRTYRVQKGDSLWRIADRALGDGGRWKEIVALNPKIDPDRLVAGQELVLPDGAKTADGPKVAIATNPDPAKVNGNDSARKGRKVR